MACSRSRRSLTSNFTLLTQRFRPSLCPVFDHDRESDHEHPQLPFSPSPSQSPTHDNSHPLRQLHNSSTGFSAMIRDRRVFGYSLPLGLEPLLCRYSSSGGGSNEFEYIKDAANVIKEKSVDVVGVLTEQNVEAVTGAVAQAAPVAGEVAAAAADSALPVAALQYLIDAIHSFTGMNWWAAIAVTTVLIRTVTIPLLIQQMKATTKLNLMRPQMDEIKQQMQNSMDPQMLQESRKQMQNLFKQYGVSPFTPLKGLLIQGPIFISFFLAISNMVEKVPSFKGGGALWFTDLTTPDPLYMLPVLTSLTFLATVELNMQEGMEGNPMADTMKNFSRVLSILTIPFTASFPKAIFCYWITSNLFSLIYGLVLKRPPVRKFLDLPEIDLQAPTLPQPSFPLFGGAKNIAAVAPPTSPPSLEQSQHLERNPKRQVSSSSVISQRIRNLERSVKARKKSKKR